jgi:glyceraldehyde 3-phosphate dehydrogenase
MTRRLRVFINGFGRIGRTIARQILGRATASQVEIVGINEALLQKSCDLRIHLANPVG